MSKIAAIIGRILLALIFILSGAGKLMDVTATETMIAGAGLPGGLAIPVGLFELLAGLCLAFGFMVRLVSALLIVFTAATILFFHSNFVDPMQQIAALKNLAMIGGLMLAFAHSQMWGHYYAITRERRGEMVARTADEKARDAEVRVHEAELRAARAEAKAEVLGTAPVGTVTATPSYTTPSYIDRNGDGVVGVGGRRRWFDW